MKHFHKRSPLALLSWLAILLVAMASADVVEDLVFEPLEAQAAGSSVPQQDLENPAENVTLPSIGGHVPDVKVASNTVGFAGSLGGSVALLSVLIVSQWLVFPSNRALTLSPARVLPPLRI